MKFKIQCNLAAEDVARQLRAWSQSSVGTQNLHQLQTQLDSILPPLFGYHAVNICNFCQDQDLLRASRINHKYTLDIQPTFGNLCALPGSLPFAADSVDLILLSHVLEYASEPHKVLREVERILVPEGHLIIIGFNPVSFYGLWRMIAGWSNRVPWCGHFYTTAKLKDWLSLLGLETMTCEYLVFRPPIRQLNVYNRLVIYEDLGAKIFPVIGGIYLLLAQKQLATLTPIKPRWRPRRNILPGNIVEPTARGQ